MNKHQVANWQDYKTAYEQKVKKEHRDEWIEAAICSFILVSAFYFLL